MRYVSLDIETSGLDWEKNQILSIGLIVEDTNNQLSFDKIPKLHIGVLNEEITGSLFALNMNCDLIQILNEYKEANKEEREKISIQTGMIFCYKDDICWEIFKFLYVNIIDTTFKFNTNGNVVIENKIIYPDYRRSTKMNKIHFTIAGKNVALFDYPYLVRLPRWEEFFKIRHRVLDPTTLYVDWKKDEVPPGLDECKVRANISGIVTHNALEDAWDVIEVLRKKY